MNLFVHWTNEDGVEELVTAPLDGTILAGVTRQTVLDLANEVRKRHHGVEWSAARYPIGTVRAMPCDANRAPKNKGLAHLPASKDASKDLPRWLR